MRQELRRFAHFLGVDVKDCLEKAGPRSIGWVEGLGFGVWTSQIPIIIAYILHIFLVG